MSEIYTLNPTRAQASIKSFLESEYPHVPILTGGQLDQDDNLIKMFPGSGEIKPFVILRHAGIRRSQSGRSVAFEHLDNHIGTVNIVVVARSEEECRILLNSIGDRMIGFKPVDAGRITKGEAMWEPSIVSMESLKRPNRWSAGDRFHYGFNARPKS